MSEQNKIDEIKEALAAATPGPWTYSAARISGEKTTVCDVWYSRDNDILTHAPEYITYLLAEIERKDEALRFYENKENWELPSFGRGHSAVISDRGKRAREAL